MSLFFLIIAVLLEGCFAGLVAGTWKEKDGEHTMVFHGNGTCADVPVKTLTGADPVSYVIEKDRTLVFTMKWDGKIAYEKAARQHFLSCQYPAGSFRK